jgi:hypothetical protein
MGLTHRVRFGTGMNADAGDKLLGGFQTNGRGHFLLRKRYWDEEAAMPVWAWILIIVLLVLLLTGGIYVRR